MKKRPSSLSMMDTSTGHLSIETREWLDQPGICDLLSIMKRDEGYAMSAWRGTADEWENNTHIPGDLLHVMRYAVSFGHDWILFDRDAERDPGLPWYEDGNEPQMPEGMGEVALMRTFTPAFHKSVCINASAYEMPVQPKRVLDDNDYAVPSGEGVWLTVGDAAIRVKEWDDRVGVHMFVSGHEMDEELSSVILEKSMIAQTKSEIEDALKAAEEPDQS